ncbi:MAG TPA: hypothetical protein VFX05_15550 [Casimicrobiaceae bacterium]|nr:hypothetical protein [Casimicrobiaceae bacterium]
MRIRRLAAAVLATTALATTSGCMTWNDRFHVPGRDPVLTFLGAQYEGQREWPAAQLPELRPMRTELIPDRVAPAATPPLNWPPL